MAAVVPILIFVTIIIVLFIIGRGLRGRARPFQIAAITGAGVVVFVALSFIASYASIFFYDFDQTVQACHFNTDPDCKDQHTVIRPDLPTLVLWLSVPKPFRPACETISPDFCSLQTAHDYQSQAYSFAAIGTLVGLLIILFGLRFKAVRLAKPILPQSELADKPSG